MPIDPTQRINRWTAKVTAARTADVVGDRLTTMRRNAAGEFVDIVTMETQVRSLLNGKGQPTIQYPFYLCFGRELWALKRRGIEGEGLAIEAALLLTKWVAQGLTSSVLQAIRTNVFSVGPPVSP